MAKISRDRGAAFEREVCAYLTAELGYVVKRQLGQARDGGGDISIGPVLIECKRRRKVGGPYTWLRQASAAALPTGQTPVVVVRADGEESLAVLRLADLIPLLRDALP